jgi:hypothetical protein
MARRSRNSVSAAAPIGRDSKTTAPGRVVFPFRDAAPPPWFGNVDLSALFSISDFSARVSVEL